MALMLVRTTRAPEVDIPRTSNNHMVIHSASQIQMVIARTSKVVTIRANCGDMAAIAVVSQVRRLVEGVCHQMFRSKP